MKDLRPQSQGLKAPVHCCESSSLLPHAPVQDNLRTILKLCADKMATERIKARNTSRIPIATNRKNRSIHSLRVISKEQGHSDEHHDERQLAHIESKRLIVYTPQGPCQARYRKEYSQGRAEGKERPVE